MEIFIMVQQFESREQDYSTKTLNFSINHFFLERIGLLSLITCRITEGHIEQSPEKYTQ